MATSEARGARRVERRVFRALMVRPTRAAVRPTRGAGRDIYIRRYKTHMGGAPAAQVAPWAGEHLTVRLRERDN